MLALFTIVSFQLSAFGSVKVKIYSSFFFSLFSSRSYSTECCGFPFDTKAFYALLFISVSRVKVSTLTISGAHFFSLQRKWFLCAVNDIEHKYELFIGRCILRLTFTTQNTRMVIEHFLPFILQFYFTICLLHRSTNCAANKNLIKLNKKLKNYYFQFFALKISRHCFCSVQGQKLVCVEHIQKRPIQKMDQIERRKLKLII